MDWNQNIGHLFDALGALIGLDGIEVYTWSYSRTHTWEVVRITTKTSNNRSPPIGLHRYGLAARGVPRRQYNPNLEQFPYCLPRKLPLIRPAGQNNNGDQEGGAH